MQVHRLVGRVLPDDSATSSHEYAVLYGSVNLTV